MAGITVSPAPNRVPSGPAAPQEARDWSNRDVGSSHLVFLLVPSPISRLPGESGRASGGAGGLTLLNLEDYPHPLPDRLGIPLTREAASTPGHYRWIITLLGGGLAGNVFPTTTWLSSLSPSVALGILSSAEAA